MATALSPRASLKRSAPAPGAQFPHLRPCCAHRGRMARCLGISTCTSSPSSPQPPACLARACRASPTPHPCVAAHAPSHGAHVASSPPCPPPHAQEECRALLGDGPTLPFEAVLSLLRDLCRMWGADSDPTTCADFLAMLRRRVSRREVVTADGDVHRVMVRPLSPAAPSPSVWGASDPPPPAATRPRLLVTGRRPGSGGSHATGSRHPWPRGGVGARPVHTCALGGCGL